MYLLENNIAGATPMSPRLIFCVQLVNGFVLFDRRT